MKYRIVLPKKIEKDYQRLDKQTKLRIWTAFISLSSNPYFGKKLEGKLKDYYAIRVWPHRIIYKIIHRDNTILIIRIGHRQGVYR